MNSHFLNDLINPKSVVFYGANNEGASLASIQLMNLISSGFEGNIYPIHLKQGSIIGFKAYKTIAEVPEIPDLVVVALPPKVIPGVLKECGDKGVRFLVVVSGGFRELDGDRKNAYTEQLVEIANKYNMRFIGPNCLGFYNGWFNREKEDQRVNMLIWGNLKLNKFSIASQSGTLSSHIWFDSKNLDLGLGKSLSVGNEANIDVVDCLEYYKDDPETEVIGLYVEEIKRARQFRKLAKEITPNKPIIAIYVGGTQAGNRALKSHTGSLAGNHKLYEALFKEVGIIRTQHVQTFLDVAWFLTSQILPKGNRVGIITNSGGPGAMIASNTERQCLTIPEFSPSLQSSLMELLPKTASAKNPIDVTFDMNLPLYYIELPELLMKSGEIDVIIQYGVFGFKDVLDNFLKIDKIAKNVSFGPQDDSKSDYLVSKLVKPVLESSRKYQIPIIHISPQPYDSPWSLRLRKNGAMLFKLWDRPVNCVAKVVEYSSYLNKIKLNKI